MTLTWNTRRFDELTTAQLYAILELRSRVFVVEQACHYLDPDGIDDRCTHVWAADETGAIAAYLRVVPAGVKYDEASIGRVIVSPAARGTGLGRELMRRGIEIIGGAPIRIAAQAYLERFYQGLGFETVSAPYDDDGIAHIDMIRR